MKRLTYILIGLIAATGTRTATATVVFEDNFDSYVDQAAFDAVWTVLPGTAAGVSYENVQLSTEQSVSPTKSAKAPAQPTSATLLQRSYHDFPAQSLATAGDKIVLSFDFYDSNAPAAAYREYAEIRSTGFASSTNQLIAIGLYNNQLESASGGPAYMGRVLGYTPFTDADPEGGPAEGTASSGSFFKLNDIATTGRTLGWHRLKVEITSDDLQSTDYYFYVDNQLAETVSNIGTSGSIRSYERIVLGSALTNASNAAYFDNVRVEYIPVGQQVGVPGDYNGNGTVDAADYVLWRENKGLIGGATAAQGDGTGDGNVDNADYDFWRLRFGNDSGSASVGQFAAVPEPTAITVMLLEIGVLLASVRRMHGG